MQRLIKYSKLIQLVTCVFLLILFFIPITSSYGVSIGVIQLMSGIKYMGFSVAEGSFVYIFVLLIPLGILILNFLNFKLKALISLVLSLFGFFMAVVINNEIGQYGDSLVIFLFFIGYIVLIAFNVITLIDDNKDKVGNMGSSIADSVKNAINSETVQQGLTNAKQAASNISGKVKNTVSDISNHDVKKASSIADQLKTYKDLLDQGIITQEEFEKKKSEIL